MKSESATKIRTIVACVAVALGCALASYWLLSDSYLDLIGIRHGVPLYKGAISQGWIAQKGGLGYPLSLPVYVAAWFSVFVGCAYSLRSAVKLSVANLAGILLMGLLALAPGYLEPCTHDAVLVGAWLAGSVAAERRIWLRWVLAVGFGIMMLNVGEIWHLLGGGWCPLTAWVGAMGKFWLWMLGMAWGLSVFGSIICERLGLSKNDWRAALAGLGLSMWVCWDWFVDSLPAGFAAWLGGSGEWSHKLGEVELGWIFGAVMPAAALSLNVALGSVSLLLWLRKRIIEGRRKAVQE